MVPSAASALQVACLPHLSWKDTWNTCSKKLSWAHLVSKTPLMTDKVDRTGAHLHEGVDDVILAPIEVL